MLEGRSGYKHWLGCFKKTMKNGEKWRQSTWSSDGKGGRTDKAIGARGLKIGDVGVVTVENFPRSRRPPEPREMCLLSDALFRLNASLCSDVEPNVSSEVTQQEFMWSNLIPVHSSGPISLLSSSITKMLWRPCQSWQCLHLPSLQQNALLFTSCRNNSEDC